MTGFQGILLMVAGPLIAVAIALIANARPGVIVGAAVLGEVASYLAARAISYRALGNIATANRNVFVAQAHAQVGTSQRLFAFGIIFGFALLIGIAGIGIRHALHWGSQ